MVRGPDLIFGGDVRGFSVPSGRFDGVLAGSPCPDFSRSRRSLPSGDGLAMLAEFRRVVLAAAPSWWLLENVPGCPDMTLPGYSFQRLDVDARDTGAAQRRLRHFQFGHRLGLVLSLPRPSSRSSDGESTCMASESNKPGRRDFARFCQLQGLPASFDLPSFTLSAKYRAVGNGVHIDVARLLARGVLAPVDPATVRLCSCGCARPVTGKALSAGPGCRKRLERKRDRPDVPDLASVTGNSSHVPDQV